MSVKEIIILAGGLGTRLRSAVAESPKCLAPVNGRPFIGYLIDGFLQQGLTRFIFSLGYKAEMVEEFLRIHYPSLEKTIITENEPLGTGGAIKKACGSVTANVALIANGDTFFDADVQHVAGFHLAKDANCTITLKEMQNFDRYGTVERTESGTVTAFKEKSFCREGLINGGIYALNVPRYVQENLPEKFSFEKDYLEKFLSERKIYSVIERGYFIDIGVPEDFYKAQDDFASFKFA